MVLILYVCVDGMGVSRMITEKEKKINKKKIFFWLHVGERRETER